MTQIRMMMSDTMSLFICFSFLRKPGHDAKNVQKDITYLESGGIKDRLCLRLSNDENKAFRMQVANLAYDNFLGRLAI